MNTLYVYVFQIHDACTHIRCSAIQSQKSGLKISTSSTTTKFEMQVIWCIKAVKCITSTYFIMKSQRERKERKTITERFWITFKGKSIILYMAARLSCKMKIVKSRVNSPKIKKKILQSNTSFRYIEYGMNVNTIHTSTMCFDAQEE